MKALKVAIPNPLAFSVLTPMDCKFLLAIFQYLETESNEIVFHEKVMHELTTNFGIAEKTIRNTISSFCKLGFFIRKKRNWYVVNSNLIYLV